MGNFVKWKHPTLGITLQTPIQHIKDLNSDVLAPVKAIEKELKVMFEEIEL